jgi:hypothetical protein
MNAAVAILGAAHVTENGVVLVQAVVPIQNDTDDVEQYGECEVIECLGHAALPWPKTKEGYAEGLLIVNVGGRDAVIVGRRDVRTAKIVGKMKPGDTVVFSTGPNMAAQLQLKEKNRQAILTTKDSDGFDMMIILDGKNNEAQVIAGGNVFKLSKKDGVVCADDTGGGFTIKGGTFRFTCDNVMLPGAAPNPAFKLMSGPATGSPGGPASVPLLAVKGVTVGV